LVFDDLDDSYVKKQSITWLRKDALQE
jgi:hypothetical protein